ncbi:MAG: 50S ribosomal protein L9 [Lachnospiraceae bacterium]|nr:50S ribosomal protein L9 [Lachnospiraceae bacterium]
MKVILLEDVKSLGKKGDVVNVSDGYARNMILPKKLGVEANSKNMNDLKLQNKHAEKVAQENLDNARALAEEVGSKEVTVTLKTGEGGRTFGSVSAKEIAAAAKEQIDMELDKKKMQLPEGGLKTLGVHEVKIKFHPKVTGTLKVKVAGE